MTTTPNPVSHKGIPELARNFPTSTAQPSSLSRFPGVTSQTTEIVRRILTENDHKYDIFEKARFAHNHFPHSALTRYALGASPQLLEDTWRADEQHLVSLDPAGPDRKVDMDKVPNKIDRNNWDDGRYLGLTEAYSRYLAFFHEEIDRLGPVETVMQYVFSPHSNWERRNGNPPAMMLLRIMGGVIHPFIHTGFGLEFRDRIVLAEGKVFLDLTVVLLTQRRLAEAAIHKTEILSKLFPSDWPRSILTDPSPSQAQRSASSRSDKWAESTYPRLPVSGKSLLEIYSDFCQNPKIKPVPYDPDMLINDRLKGCLKDGGAESLFALGEEWSLTDEEVSDGSDGWTRKLEEVAVLGTLLACATGRKGKDKKVDFFLMHALTSSTFLPSYMPILSIPERRAILISYLLVLLHTSLSRGRPHLDIDLLMSYSLHPVGPGNSSQPGQSPDALSNPSKEDTRNARLSIVESSLYSQDSHVPKSIRSLVHHAETYGHHPPGGFIGAINRDGNESIPGMGKADGTIFIRAAGLIMDVTGWVREGQEAGNWDQSALGYDESWI